VINEAGTGAQPTASSNVTVAYKGYLQWIMYFFDQKQQCCRIHLVEQ
jgi:FKBP-type peptidyl-prolyl cis-trans isomerase